MTALLPRTVYLDTAGAHHLAGWLVDDGLIPELRGSDCQCPGHLAWFPEAPVFTPAFQALLVRWRHAAA